VNIKAVFFYGTLADLELLSLVVARAVTTAELRPASLPGFRRLTAAEELFPVCVPDPGSRTDGVAMVSPTPTDLDRILYYEGVDYDLVPVAVDVDGGTIEAHMCQLTDRLPISDDPWCFDRWRARDKPLSLLEADEIMRYFEILDFEALEAKWPELKRQAEIRHRRGERPDIPR